MAWVSVHDGIVDHPKTRKFAALLCCTRHEAIGILVSLWQWGLRNADRNGVIQYATEDDIADGIMYRPSVGQSDGHNNGYSEKTSRTLLNALTKSGWIEKENDTFILHDWSEWQSEWFKYLDKLEADKRRKREEREKQRKSTGIFERPSVGQSDGQSHGNPPVTNTITSTNTNTLKEQEPPHNPPQAGEVSGRDNADLQTTRFNAFWKAYPKKVAKGEALKSWKKIKPDTAKFNKILDAITSQTKSEQWQRENGRYIPNPATWLNQGRWDDEIPMTGGEPIERVNANKPSNAGFHNALDGIELDKE